MNLELNERDYTVREPQLHDAKLTAVTVENRQVRLRFKTLASKDVTLTLNGVMGISMNSFFENNDVFQVSLVPLSLARLEDIQKSMHVNGDAQASNAQLAQMKNRGLLLFSIEPSFGADIVAVCSDVDWEYLGKS